MVLETNFNGASWIHSAIDFHVYFTVGRYSGQEWLVVNLEMSVKLEIHSKLTEWAIAI